MRQLFWTLATLDCLAAMNCRSTGDFESACRYVARAARFLECRARSRDTTEPWQPVYFVDQTKVRLDSSGRPVVAYRAHTTTADDVFVTRWTGSAWDMTYGGAGLAATQDFDLVLDAQEVPILATTTPINGITSWTGTGWRSTTAPALSPRWPVSTQRAPP